MEIIRQSLQTTSHYTSTACLHTSLSILFIADTNLLMTKLLLDISLHRHIRSHCDRNTLRIILKSGVRESYRLYKHTVYHVTHQFYARIALQKFHFVFSKVTGHQYGSK